MEVKFPQGFLFLDPQDKSWHIHTERGIYPLHPDDVEDPMMCLSKDTKVGYGYVESHKEASKITYAKIIRFL